MYALAAGAAGVRILTLAQPSEVKIVIPVVSELLARLTPSDFGSRGSVAGSSCELAYRNPRAVFR